MAYAYLAKQSDDVIVTLPERCSLGGSLDITFRDYAAFERLNPDYRSVRNILSFMCSNLPKYRAKSGRTAAATFLADPATPIGDSMHNQYKHNLRYAIAYHVARFEGGMVLRKKLLQKNYPISRPFSTFGSYFWGLSAEWTLLYCREQGFKLCESAESEIADEMQGECFFGSLDEDDLD